MFSYLMGNFFHNLKHILESQLYLGIGVDYRSQQLLVPATILTVHMLPIIFLSIADWKKMTSHEIFSFEATKECQVKKCFNSNDFDLLFTYWLAGLFFFACTTICLLICTLISENQDLEKLRFASNLRKISSTANLDFFF